MKTRQAKKILKETFRSLKQQAKQGSSLLKNPYKSSQIQKACIRLKRRRLNFFDASAVLLLESLRSYKGMAKNPALAEFQHLKQLV